MDVTLERVSDVVTERFFTVGDVRGVVWSPTGAKGPRPLILLGHGGGQHKSSEAVVARAHHYVTNGGFMVAAIDAPGHGARSQTGRGQQLLAAIRDKVSVDKPTASDLRRYNAELAARAIPDWQATLDALLAAGETTGPVGYWGVSLGAALGIRLLVAEPRITAAVLGLAQGSALLALAESITIPIEFLLQWDDEFVSRERGLALFDAFASVEKTLHANTGRHNEMPSFEMEGSQRFFSRHLLVGSESAQ
ncbi:dienelactone hydrolase family protein [Nocardia sp. CDC160]|uniref:dienelactone hydrolase family protein n=1 Tax=Nocardia sp. CDC160 TaxID=3112166 RepID=UPI002DB5D5CA|nr:alpha/beta hydrolase [Nocardia sp. CDC160]MEC3919166.1 alpha/beta hydrolase [Nocardia sp. CDC160]